MKQYTKVHDFSQRQSKVLWWACVSVCRWNEYWQHTYTDDADQSSGRLDCEDEHFLTVVLNVVFMLLHLNEHCAEVCLLTNTHIGIINYM